jgi:hypothetical protein
LQTFVSALALVSEEQEQLPAGFAVVVAFAVAVAVAEVASDDWCASAMYATLRVERAGAGAGVG